MSDLLTPHQAIRESLAHAERLGIVVVRPRSLRLKIRRMTNGDGLVRREDLDAMLATIKPRNDRSDGTAHLRRMRAREAAASV